MLQKREQAPKCGSNEEGTSASTGRLSENLTKIVKLVLWEGNMLLVSNISACVEIHSIVDKPTG
jgi:hypothetical protein